MNQCELNEAVRIATPIIALFEGFSAEPYLCPAGVPTIGYGSTFYASGRKVQLTDSPIDKRTAANLLQYVIKAELLPTVCNLCPGLETPKQLAAILDFAYNLGLGALRASTLRKRINAQDWEAAAYEIKRWNKSGGKALNGLTKRRRVEANLLKGQKHSFWNKT